MANFPGVTAPIDPTVGVQVGANYVVKVWRFNSAAVAMFWPLVKTGQNPTG